MKRHTRVWEHKETKQKVRAHPWMEIPESMDEVEKELQTLLPDRQVRFGVLFQIGWLIENEQNVWFGVHMRAQESFNDLGEWKPKKKRKSRKK